MFGPFGIEILVDDVEYRVTGTVCAPEESVGIMKPYLDDMIVSRLDGAIISAEERDRAERAVQSVWHSNKHKHNF